MRLSVLVAAVMVAMTHLVAVATPATALSMIMAKLDGQSFGAERTVGANRAMTVTTNSTRQAGTYTLYSRPVGTTAWITASRVKVNGKPKTVSLPYRTATMVATQRPPTYELRVVFDPTRSDSTLNSRTQKIRLLYRTTLPASGMQYGFRYLPDRTPARWDPCSKVTYRVDTSGLSSTKARLARADAASAAAAIGQHSGLRIVPVKSGGGIVISYKAPASDTAAGDTVVKQKDVKGAKYDQITSAKIRVLPSLTDRYKTYVVLHEMVHAVGVGHSSSDTGVMGRAYQPLVFNSGDVRGLQAVGAAQGCL